MAVTIAIDQVSGVFSDLRSKNEEVRRHTVKDFKACVLLAQRDLSPEGFAEYYRLVNSKIAQAIQHGTDTSDRLGGIGALDAIIDLDGVDPAQKTTHFSQYLRSVLRTKDLVAMVPAAVALGKLCRPGGALVSDLVEAEVKTALEWLQIDRTTEKRLAAALILRELGKNAQTLIYGFIPLIFDDIWTILRDEKVLIRTTAAEVLCACFQIIRERDQNMRQLWLEKVYNEAVQCIRMTQTECVHASLLALRELLEQGGMFMHASYDETCEIVYKHKDHRDQLIRKQVIVLIPILADYSPSEFGKKWLHKFMVYLSIMLGQDKARNDAFLAIGSIANAVKSGIAPYLEVVLKYVQDGLRAPNQKLGSLDPIFDCISRLAVAVGQTLSKYMEDLLESMFRCQLTPKLTQALVDIAFYVPPVRPIIQERLLDMLSKVLCGEPFKPLGALTFNSIPPPPPAKDLKDPVAIENRQAEVKLALNTLGSFDFTGHVLNEFVRDVAIRYVEDDNPEIREAAALTCCQLFVRDPVVSQTSHHSVKVVSDVIQKLLTVGVADPVPHIRKTVLAALDRRFDRHLAKSHNVRTLFFALNDEVFAVREVAIMIIGRLTPINPAYVIPSLRKVLIQMLLELEYTEVARNKEESAKLISLLVQNSQGLIKPYVDSMIKTLLPKARDSVAAVAATVIVAIGDLATVGGEDMLPYIDELMPIIIDTLQDQTSVLKREAALRTLGQLASNAGYVIQPYLEYPQLLDILRSIIRTEPHKGPLRHETVKLMGILGALDPYRHQQVEEKSPEVQARNDPNSTTDISLMMTGLSPSDKEYFPTVVINALLQILKDSSLMQHHAVVVEAITNIFRTLGLECVQFLDRIVPAFLSVIRSVKHTALPTRLESYFNQLSILVNIVRQHIRPYLTDIVGAIQEFWGVSQSLQATIMQLVEAIARSLEGEFKVYLAALLPHMLSVLERDTSPRRQASERVLHSFLVFGASSEEYMHLIIPVIVKVFEKPSQPTPIRKAAIETIGKISRQVNLNDYASKIIHPLSRVLAGSDATLRIAALDTLCALIFQLGQDYLHFAGTIGKVLATQPSQHPNYDRLINNLRKGEPLPQDLSPEERYHGQVDDSPFADISNKKLESNPIHLKTAWDSGGKSTKEDWNEWMRKFSVTLLIESPNHALRACAQLASIHPPLAKELFNSAFVSCWGDLFETYQDELIENMVSAMRSPHITPDLLAILLNLAEFMEHDDKALPIDIRILGREAGRCHAYAKALHYKELEFLQDQTSLAVEALIQINNQLQQYDAAIGILRRAQLYSDGITLRETWFEKLERWEEALTFYEKREAEQPDLDPDDAVGIIIGKMRCLHALGEWELLSNLAQEKWHTSDLEVQRIIAPLGTAAAWGLGKWDLMDDYISVMKRYSPDWAFFGSILALHRNQFREATAFVQKAREGLDTELGALVSESYTRAYNVIVRVQMLAEIEELIVYKQSAHNPAKQETMRRTWEKRLLGCQRNVEVWQRMLKLRALVISPEQNMPMSIKFSNLCRKSGRFGLAEKSLRTLMGTTESLDSILPFLDGEGSPNGYARNAVHSGHSKPIPPQVKYAILKYHWSTGKQPAALLGLKNFTAEMADKLQQAQLLAHAAMNANERHTLHGAYINGVNGNPAFMDQKQMAELTQLLAKCFLKQGEWQVALNKGNWQNEQVSDILGSYLAATQFDPKWYKAWHAWALANFEIVQAAGIRTERDFLIVPPSVIPEHVVPAIRGFFQSIALSQGSTLQDALRLLTMWFAHGGNAEVNTAVTEGFGTVSVDTWLEVIPQLIARINQPNTRVRQSIHNLLAEVGRAHPQALVYPLTVAMKSGSVVENRRSRSATQILDSMRQHSLKLVEQADLVSHELIRVAVLWHEQWHEALEEASRLYFGDGNIEGMFETLAPLHDQLDRGPQTLRETSFHQTFGRDLQEAREWCFTYKSSKDVSDLNQAWDLYYHVFRRITRQLPQMDRLELTYVSPNLLAARDLDLAIPGTYQSGKPVTSIVSIDPIFNVIQSKQRPRKLTMTGSDGVSYAFLLKGHEDIRQDERVMQLFGLFNTLLSTDSESYKRHLCIQRYPAIPLSQNSGLLGWVPNSDTIHVLIKEYRETRKILLNIEHRIMLQMAPDYDNLTLMQKVEVFGYALDNTTGQDLYRVMWLKSKSSESWLDRRTNFTRSLGVMSIAGYILGLGDRHPSNLMMDRYTGKIIHIDFGDCFEIAMYRDKYPEQVPFRLTRMLTYAMEVSNIEGSFRITCENVMRVVRDNKESVMAVMEAFVHDPLLSWRLLTPEPVATKFGGPRPDRRNSIMDGDARRPSLLNSAVPPPNRFIADEHDVGPTILAGGPPSSRPRARTNSISLGETDLNAGEAKNERALQVVNRVKEKLTGRDFNPDEELVYTVQVDRLLTEATKLENLCQHYIGWCSFW